MKELIRISAFAATAAIIILAARIPALLGHGLCTLSPEEISWIEFCRHAGYDPHTDAPAAIDQYLDTWRGSSLEEEALARTGSPQV